MSDEERGSLIIAMAVIMVLSGLALAVLARTVSALNSARTSQDGSAALAAANAGLSDALYQLDQSTTAPPSIPPSGNPPRRGTVGAAATYQWRATQAGDPNTYQLTSTGTVNSRVRTVTETVTRPPRYPFALFAKDGLYLNGSSAVTGKVGSNRAIVNGAGDSQTYYSPNGSCSDCPTPVSAAGPYETVAPVAPTSALPCPHIEPHSPIDPGVYLCTGDLTLTGDVSVGSASALDPVVIYVTGDLNLGGLTMGPSNDPSGLQILKVGTGRINPGSGARFIGIIDAPGAVLSASSCSLSTVGALVVDVFSCDGTSLAYDSRVQALLSDAWRPSEYHEIPTPASL